MYNKQLPDVVCSMPFNRGFVEDFLNRPENRIGWRHAMSAYQPIRVRVGKTYVKAQIHIVALLEDTTQQFRIVHISSLS